MRYSEYHEEVVTRHITVDCRRPRSQTIRDGRPEHTGVGDVVVTVELFQEPGRMVNVCVHYAGEPSKRTRQIVEKVVTMLYAQLKPSYSLN